MPNEVLLTESFFNHFFPKDRGVSYKDLKISDVGLYSISDYKSADKITDLIINEYGKDIVITDATANVGGNTISFAKKFKTVNAIEIENVHCDIITHNIKAYKLSNINVICEDYLKAYKNLKQDVIFIDAPWGGVDYKKKELVDLYLGYKSIGEVINLIKSTAKLIVLKVPKNFNFVKFNNITNYTDYKVCVFRRSNNTVKFLIVLLFV